MIDQSYIKIIFLFFLNWFAFHQLAAQPKFPQDFDYDSLLSLAKQHKKPMFLAIHQRSEEFSPFINVSISQKTKNILNEQFVSGTVRLASEDINHPLHKTYRLTTPIYLFTDEHGYPLLRHNKPIDQEETLMKLIDSAKTIGEGETMGKLVQQYKKGIRSRLLLMNLLKQYQTFDQYTDQQVLNDYVSQLSVQELNNFETVVFLLRCGPVYNSKTYQLAYTNRKMVDSLYSTLPLPRRQEINNRIIYRTFREALDKKDYSLSQTLGQFVGRTWQSNYLRAQMGRSYYPMEYNRLLQDTAVYIQMAQNYYNTFFYRVAADSIAKLDFANGREIRPHLRRGQLLDSAENILFQQWMGKNRKRYEETQVRSLNYGANQLVKFGNDNPDVLFDAIRWLKKSITLRPDRGQSHHILAKALYHVGFYAEAETEQQRAVELYKPQKHYHKQMRDVLKQMQDRSL